MRAGVAVGRMVGVVNETGLLEGGCEGLKVGFDPVVYRVGLCVG